jgi:CARDB
MRFRLLTAALTTVALVAAASAAGAGAPPASVRLASCSVEQHSAAFYARMKLVEGAESMALRFTLLVKTGLEGDKVVKAPGLRRWHRSKPGVVSLRYRQGLRNLGENASYRARVDFRWYSSSGAEVLRAQRRSARCRQFVALPNLVAKLTAVRPAKVPGVVRYESLVSNSGDATVAAAPVRLTVDGDVVDTVSLSLGPDESRTVVIRGPKCRRLARVEVDPEKAIAETSEADNADELSCASPARL